MMETDEFRSSRERTRNAKPVVNGTDWFLSYYRLYMLIVRSVLFSHLLSANSICWKLAFCIGTVCFCTECCDCLFAVLERAPTIWLLLECFSDNSTGGLIISGMQLCLSLRKCHPWLIPFVTLHKSKRKSSNVQVVLLGKHGSEQTVMACDTT